MDLTNSSAFVPQSEVKEEQPLLKTGAELLAQPFLERAFSYPCGLRGDSNPCNCKTYGDFRMKLYWQEWMNGGNPLPENATFKHVEEFIQRNPELVIYAAESTQTGRTPSLRNSKRKRGVPSAPRKTTAAPDAAAEVAASSSKQNKAQQDNNFESTLLRGTPLRGLDRPSLNLKTKLKFPLIKALMHVRKDLEIQMHLQQVALHIQRHSSQPTTASDEATDNRTSTTNDTSSAMPKMESHQIDSTVPSTDMFLSVKPTPSQEKAEATSEPMSIETAAAAAPPVVQDLAASPPIATKEAEGDPATASKPMSTVVELSSLPTVANPANPAKQESSDQQFATAQQLLALSDRNSKNVTTPGSITDNRNKDDSAREAEV